MRAPRSVGVVSVIQFDASRRGKKGVKSSLRYQRRHVPWWGGGGGRSAWSTLDLADIYLYMEGGTEKKASEDIGRDDEKSTENTRVAPPFWLQCSTSIISCDSLRRVCA